MKMTLPPGWQRLELGEIVTLKSGGTPNRATGEFWGGNVPWLSAKDLKSFDLKDSIERLTQAGALQVNTVPADTVLMLVRGMGLFKDIPIGVTSFEMTFNQDVKALIPKVKVNSRFLAYALTGMRNAIMGRVDRAGHGTGRLTTDYLIALPIAFPPFMEQARIVNVLSVWDKAISETEQLIDARERKKRGLVQKLFSNLPRRPLMETADVWFSGVDKKTRADQEPVLLCNYMDVFHNSRITSNIEFMRATASTKEIEDNSLKKNDVVFTKDSETSEEIAEPALVADDIPNLVCGYHLAIARPREGVGHGPFIAQAMRHQAIRWQFCRLANGVVRFGLTLDAMEQAEIFWADLDVQRHIATILDAEDVAIEALRKRASFLLTQKRGLMQRLLTGDTVLDQRFDAPLENSTDALVGTTI